MSQDNPIQIIKEIDKASALDKAIKATALRLKSFTSLKKSIVLVTAGQEALAVTVGALENLNDEELGFITFGLAEEIVGEDDQPQVWRDFSSKFRRYDKFASLLPFFVEGLNLNETTDNYEAVLDLNLRQCDYSLLVLSIDKSGKIAGIEPQEEIDFGRYYVDDLVVYFKKNNEKHLSITKRGLSMFDDVVSVTEESHEYVATKLSERKPVYGYPAQLLKMCDRCSLYGF